MSDITMPCVVCSFLCEVLQKTSVLSEIPPFYIHNTNTHTCIMDHCLNTHSQPSTLFNIADATIIAIAYAIFNGWAGMEEKNVNINVHTHSIFKNIFLKLNNSKIRMSQILGTSTRKEGLTACMLRRSIGSVTLMLCIQH